MNNTSLPLPSPDFDSLKSSLKDFMKNSDELKDYDFNGSTLSIMLDTLSYNSHFNAFWLNMVGNESHLKTAIKRQNVVASAQDMKYKIKGSRSAYTELYIEFRSKLANPEPYIIVPAGSSFSADSSSSSYTFSTLDDVKISFDYNKKMYISDDIKVFEGRLLVHEWNITNSLSLDNNYNVSDVTFKGLSIPNVNVDTETMKIYVLDTNSSSEYIEYSRYDGGLKIDNDSNIYFIRENELGLTTVTFGDGILGKLPSIGSKIKIVYFVSSGTPANNIVNFSPLTTYTDLEVLTVRSKFPSAGGRFPESIESIKYNSQIDYESQGRAVLAGDYESLVKKVYNYTKKVISWGGQDNIPPEYGKVFISIQVEDGLILTKKQKKEIIDFISKKNVTTITPVIVDPDYIYLNIDIDINWKMSNSATAALQNNVIEAVKSYAIFGINTFNKSLEYSKLLGIIDSTSDEIISNMSNISLTKRINIINNKQSDFILSFGNQLKPGTIESSDFSYSTYSNCKLKDNNGKIEIITKINNITSVLVSNIGDINYSTGTITLNKLNITNTDNLFSDIVNNGYYVKLKADPVSNNIQANRNQILSIDNIKVN